MLVETVRATAFGPLNDATLELAPSLNVVYGPNESGKSTWHAALYLGLCGARRGRGKCPSRDILDRYRPWDREEFALSVVLRLADGRRVAIERNLESLTGEVTDLDLGKDITNEIIFEGAPDGSRWLGLDRKAFLATACICQADVLGILDDPKLLQQHMQRAAATAGSKSTAVSAIERIEKYLAEYVGSERPNSKKPLRAAMDRAAEAQRLKAEAERSLEELNELRRGIREKERRVAELAREQASLEASILSAEVRALEDRYEKARILSQKHPQEPPRPADEDKLGERVAAAIRGWETAPEPPGLDGRSAEEIKRELASLPPMPEGDLEPAKEILAARDALVLAERDLARHDDRRPFVPEPSWPEDLAEETVAELARTLETPIPEVPADLLRRRQRAQARLERIAREGSALGVVGAGIALAAAGLLVSQLVEERSFALAGGLAGLGGLVLAALGFVRLSRRKAEREAAAAEYERIVAVLAPKEALAREARRRREEARQRIRTLGLSEDAGELRDLAARIDARDRAKKELAEWEAERERLEGALDAARAELATRLGAKGIAAKGDLAEAVASYEEACHARAAAARQAARRPTLERLLEQRRELERNAEAARRARAEAERELRAVAQECGVAGASAEAILEGLRAWRKRRDAEKERIQRDYDEWNELQRLLGGSTLEELEATLAAKRGELEKRLAAGAVVEEGASLDELASRRRRVEGELRSARAELDESRGRLDERTRRLPSLAEAEEELEDAENELYRLRRLKGTLELTKSFLEKAQEKVHRTIAPILSRTVEELIETITRGRYSEVMVDPEELAVRVRARNGKWREAEGLSHGAMEQVYLLLRIALARHLTREGESCPLLLDDVTVQSDAERTVGLLELLKSLSREQQIIVFSQEEEVARWARSSLDARRDRIVELDASLIAA